MQDACGAALLGGDKNCQKQQSLWHHVKINTSVYCIFYEHSTKITQHNMYTGLFRVYFSVIFFVQFF